MVMNSKMFEDLSKLASGATGAMLDMKRGIDVMVKHQFEAWTHKLDLVSRDEFETVKAMAEKARIENNALIARIEALEGRTTAKKPATARPRKPKSSPPKKS